MAYGLTSQGYDVYLATGLTAGQTEREGTEQDMRHAFVAEEDLVAMITRGDIVDSCTVAAYGLLLLDRQR